MAGLMLSLLVRIYRRSITRGRFIVDEVITDDASSLHHFSADVRSGCCCGSGAKRICPTRNYRRNDLSPCRIHPIDRIISDIGVQIEVTRVPDRIGLHESPERRLYFNVL